MAMTEVLYGGKKSIPIREEAVRDSLLKYLYRPHDIRTIKTSCSLKEIVRHKQDIRGKHNRF